MSDNNWSGVAKLTKLEPVAGAPQWVNIRNQEGTLDSDVLVGKHILKTFNGDRVVFCMCELIDGSMKVGERVDGVYNF